MKTLQRNMTQAEIDELRNNFSRMLSKYLQFDISKSIVVNALEDFDLATLYHSELVLPKNPLWAPILLQELDRGYSSFGVLCALVLAGNQLFRRYASQYLTATLSDLIAAGCAAQHQELVEMVMNGLRDKACALINPRRIEAGLTCLGIDWQSTTRKDQGVA